MLKKIAHLFTTIFDSFTNFLLAIAGTMILAMVFTTTYAVISRYIFGNPESYSYELTMMFLLFSFVFAVSQVERRQLQIRADFISNKLPKRLEYFVVKVFSPFLGLLYVSVLTWKGFENALWAFEIDERGTAAWRQPMGYIKIVLPIGFCLLVIALIMNLVKGIAQFPGAHDGDNTPLSLPDEEKQGA